MKKELYVSNLTGEVLEGSQAIHQYYAVDGHKCLDDWLEEWQFAGYSDEDDTTTAQDIANLFKSAAVI